MLEPTSHSDGLISRRAVGRAPCSRSLGVLRGHAEPQNKMPFPGFLLPGEIAGCFSEALNFRILPERSQSVGRKWPHCAHKRPGLPLVLLYIYHTVITSRSYVTAYMTLHFELNTVKRARGRKIWKKTPLGCLKYMRFWRPFKKEQVFSSGYVSTTSQHTLTPKQRTSPCISHPVLTAQPWSTPQKKQLAVIISHTYFTGKFNYFA